VTDTPNEDGAPRQEGAPPAGGPPPSWSPPGPVPPAPTAGPVPPGPVPPGPVPPGPVPPGAAPQQGTPTGPFPGTPYPAPPQGYPYPTAPQPTAPYPGAPGPTAPQQAAPYGAAPQGAPYPGQPFTGAPYPGQPPQGAPFQAPGYPAPGLPAGAPPAKPRGPRRTWWLVAVLGVVVLALAGAEGAVLVSAQHRRDSDERKLSAAHSRAGQDSAESETPGALDVKAPDLAALQAGYKAVQSADRDVDSAVSRWQNVNGTKFRDVTEALETCFRRVDDYNRAAGPYSASQLTGGLPAKIDLANAATDCGRPALARITGAIS